MGYRMNDNFHEAAAVREDEAATRSTSKIAAFLHTMLAGMHREKASQNEAVMQAMKIAYGD